MNDADQPRHRVAAIDIGTVSSRLSLAEVAGGRVLAARKHTEITDLGQGVDATGRFAADAVARVVDACRVFVDEARAFGAEAVSTTLTSAARDAANAAELLGPLRELGLIPQVIPGEVEARLTFLRSCARFSRRAHCRGGFGRRFDGDRGGELPA